MAERIRAHAGNLAADRLVTLLQRENIDCPDPTSHRPGATEEEIERSRRRRNAEVRENFLAQGYERSAQRAVGVVSGWGSDYPSSESPLWKECVLEGVAAGIRGRLIRLSVENMQADRDAVFSQVEDMIGKEVAELHTVLLAGVDSIAKANQAVAGALGAIDTVVPEVVWNKLLEEVPLARGEWER